jgi:hypothetical protein
MINYGIILCKLIYGVFASCDTSDHYLGYALPLSNDNRNRAADFKEELSEIAAKLEDMLPQDIDGILHDDEIDR